MIAAVPRRVVIVTLGERGKVVDRVDRTHETVDPKHESRGQERRDAEPGRSEQA